MVSVVSPSWSRSTWRVTGNVAYTLAQGTCCMCRSVDRSIDASLSLGNVVINLLRAFSLSDNRYGHLFPWSHRSYVDFFLGMPTPSRSRTLLFHTIKHTPSFPSLSHTLAICLVPSSLSSLTLVIPPSFAHPTCRLHPSPSRRPPLHRPRRFVPLFFELFFSNRKGQ